MKSILLGVAAIAAASLTTAASATSWTLKLSNIDDEMNVYVNGNVVSTCKFGHKCKIDLDPFLQGGSNTVGLLLTNKQSGWTFKYDLLKDGTKVLSQSCGTFNQAGCLADQQDEGTVFEVNFNIVK